MGAPQRPWHRLASMEIAERLIIDPDPDPGAAEILAAAETIIAELEYNDAGSGPPWMQGPGYRPAVVQRLCQLADLISEMLG